MKLWWKPRTLRFRLALWYALGGAVLLTAFSAALYGFVAQRMARPLSQQLRQDLGQIQARLEVRADREVWWDGTKVPPDAVWDPDDPWFELWDAQGQLVRRFWPFTEKRLDRMPAPPARGSDTLSVFNVSPDISLRVLSTPYRVAGEGATWMIRVMRVHEPAANALGALLAIIIVSLPLVVVLLVVGGLLITRHWLRPLELMVRRAEGITAENLGQRLPDSGAGDELDRLASAFNQTLGRLEDSFRALDRFVADASHELRTPLTALRTVGEVGLRRSRTVEEYREIIGSMLEEAQRLQQLVERLLELASVEGGAKPMRRQNVQLDEFVAACVNDIAVLAEQKHQQISVVAGAGAVVTDPVLLGQALQNLLENAIKYSPAGSKIRVTVSARDKEIRIAVEDEGPGIPAGQMTQLANRFYRVEGSRTRGEGGFGLGLAITKAYLQVIGGRLECRPGDPSGSCFSLILPDSTAR